MSYVALGRFRSRHLIARVTNKCVKNAPSTLRTLLCMHVCTCTYLYTLDFANKRAYEPIPGSLNLTRLRYMMHVYSKFLCMVNLFHNQTNHFFKKYAYTRFHQIFHYCTKLSLKFEVNEVSMYVSMTSLLTHAVAHSNRSSFRPKTNNQPIF